MPTDDPFGPPEVQRTKKIQNDIKQHVDILEGEDSNKEVEEEGAEPASDEQQA